MDADSVPTRLSMSAYFVDWIKPSAKGWTNHRLVNQDEAPAFSYVSDNVQERVITVMCANQTEVATVIKTLQNGDEWVNVVNNINPVHHSINLFQGTITALRYLRTDTFDAGQFIPNAKI